MLKTTAQFIVQKPVLWFELIGHREGDSLPGLPASEEPVYRSVLAYPGDRFYVIDGNLILATTYGTLSRGTLRLGGMKENVDHVKDLGALLGTDEVTVGGNARLRCPAVPKRAFDQSHSGVERHSVSMAFSILMDATEEFRHQCGEEGAFHVTCADFGSNRTVSLSVMDGETFCPVIHVEHDPQAGTATIMVTDDSVREQVFASLDQVCDGFVEEGRRATVSGWKAETGWTELASAMSRHLLDGPRAEPTMQMAMAY